MSKINSFKMTKNILACILLLFSLKGIAQNCKVPDSFKQLDEIYHEKESDVYAYAKTFSLDGIEYIKFDEEYIEAINPQKIAFVQLKPDQKEQILLSFTHGLSEDLFFIFDFIENDSITKTLELPGQQIYIPGNGNIYTSGIANNTFNKRKKYKFVNGEFVEVEQPLYYVGKTTTTKALIKIYSDKDQKNLVATLPKDSKIEILASEFTSDNKYYLIKTSFGLVGWWELDNWYSEKINDFFYHGD